MKNKKSSTPPASLLITHAHLLNPTTGEDMLGSVFIEGGRLVAINATSKTSTYQADQTIDLNGNYLTAGLVDIGVRLSDPTASPEKLYQLMDSAAQSGITTMVLNSHEESPLDTPAMLRAIQHQATEHGGVRVKMAASMTQALSTSNAANPAYKMSEMAALKEAGAVAVMMPHFLDDARLALSCMRYAHAFGLSIWCMPIIRSLVEQGLAHDGVVAGRLGLSALPIVAETMAIAGFGELALEIMAGKNQAMRNQKAPHFLVHHISAQRSLQTLAHYPSLLAAIPLMQIHGDEHHLLDFNPSYRQMPPLRSPADKQALRQALTHSVMSSTPSPMGDAFIIHSNHKNPSADAASMPFGEAPLSGGNLQNLLGGVIQWALEDGVPLSKALSTITTAPAQLINNQQRLGLMVGQKADLCAFSLNAKTTKGTPRNTSPACAKTLMTIVGGEIVYDDR